MDENIIYEKCTGFEWDAGNHNKNQQKHSVSQGECEQVFFNKPLLIYKDMKHSNSEERLYLLGRTEAGRPLFIAFTIRNQLIRVISARDMSKKERKIYEQVYSTTKI
jgi:uncharacterized protein